MTNKFVEELETIGKDVVKVVMFVPSLGVKIVKLIEDGKVLTPQVKAAIEKIFNDAEAIAKEAVIVETTKGLSFEDDKKLIELLKPLAVDVLALKPLIDTIIADVKADIA